MGALPFRLTQLGLMGTFGYNIIRMFCFFVCLFCFLFSNQNQFLAGLLRVVAENVVTDTQMKYCNPHCACVQRKLKTLGTKQPVTMLTI